MPFGRKQICKTDSNYIPVPKLGDHLVIFTTGFGGEDHRLVVIESGADVLAVAPNGQLSLPRQFAQSPDRHSGISSLHDLGHAIEAQGRKAQEH